MNNEDNESVRQNLKQSLTNGNPDHFLNIFKELIKKDVEIEIKLEPGLKNYREV